MNRQWLFAKCETGVGGIQRWHKHRSAQTRRALRLAISNLSYAYRRHPTNTNRLSTFSAIFFTRSTQRAHRRPVTCTEYAHREPGSATFRHLRINAVISSTRGNSLLASQPATPSSSPANGSPGLKLYQNVVLASRKPIYEYFSAENTTLCPPVKFACLAASVLLLE